MTTRAEKEQERRRAAMKTEAEKRAWRKEFRKLKEQVYEFEKTNRRYLVLYCYTPGWWRMGGNSALIYCDRVAKQIGAKPKLKADRDFFAQFKHGVVTVRNIDALEEKLRQVRIYRLKGDQKRVIFQLEYEVPPEDMKIMQEADEVRQKQFNSLVLPEVKAPQYYASLRTLCEGILPQVMKMNGPQRDLYGIEVGKKLLTLRIDFVRMANGQIGQQQYLNEALKELQWLRAWLAAMSDARILGIEMTLRLAELIIDLCEQTERMLKEC